jgi:hypothetical protein
MELRDETKVQIKYILDLIEEYKDNLKNNKIKIEDNREIFSCEIFKELIDSQTEKEFIKYLKTKNLTFVKRHKDLELNLSYLRENDRFKKYFSKIFSGREDNTKTRYEILVFRNEEVEVSYGNTNKSV